MAFCKACQRDTAQYFEMLPSVGMVERCGHGDCHQPIDGSPLPSPGRAPRAMPAPAQNPFGEFANAEPGMSLANLPGAPLAAPAPPAPVPVQPPVVRAPRPGPPAEPRPLADITPELRARLAFVAAELKKLKALEAEGEQLVRMLCVVDPPPPSS